MLVERFYVDNPLRNFNYLVACAETGEALAIDPLEVDAVVGLADARGWRITQVLLTHHHWDHAGKREEMRAATRATVAAHADAPLDGIDRRLAEGDVVEVGRTVRLTAMDTPGHTRSHICLLGHGQLFAGDTLFAAGCGNCHNGGDPPLLWQTFSERLWKLPDDTVVQPGHDYAVNNLRFSLDREPSNEAARQALARAEALARSGEFLSTRIGDERRHNPFFRTHNPELREVLGVAADAADRDVFLALRDRRNRW